MRETELNSERTKSIPKNWKLAKILKLLKELKPELERKFNVSKIGVFGSFVRNEQHSNSDVDLLVEFTEPIGLKIIDLKEFLEEKLGRRIDLISSEGMSPYIKPYIEKEIVYV